MNGYLAGCRRRVRGKSPTPPPSLSAAAPREECAPIGSFSFTHIPQRRLFEDVHRVERPGGQAALIASPLKSLADYVYAHRLDWTGTEPLIESLRIPPSHVAEIEPHACQSLTENYRSRRVRRFLAGLAREMTSCPSN